VVPPFSRFFEETRVVVLRFLVLRVGPHDAEDCFQETFLSALKAYPQLEPDSNMRGWVLRIAEN
jgi:DNA-directed RNA polymerase specialized sigma24 family protein